MLAKRTGKGRVAVANPEVERELALLQSRSGSPAAVQALAAAIEERDNYTHEHSELVVRLSRGVAMMLGLPHEDVERIAHAALLHDVGKLAMPAELLQKQGPLTHEEWAIMSEHPIVGERILARTTELAGSRRSSATSTSTGTAPATRTGSSASEIPVGSRVILACDAYVAMTTSRPYRGALEPDQAIAELQAGAGRSSTPTSSTRSLTCWARTHRRSPTGQRASSSPPCRRASLSPGGRLRRIGYRAGDASPSSSAAPCRGSGTARPPSAPSARSARRCRHICPWPARRATTTGR